MSEPTTSIVIAVAALVIVVMTIKLLGSIVKAFVLALVAAAALYFFLPSLEKQDGAIGDAAKKAREVSDGIEDSVESIKSGAKMLKDEVDRGVDRAKEAAEVLDGAQGAVKRARDAAEKLPDKALP